MLTIQTKVIVFLAVVDIIVLVVIVVVIVMIITIARCLFHTSAAEIFLTDQTS